MSETNNSKLLAVHPVTGLLKWAFGGLGRMAATGFCTGLFIVIVGMSPGQAFAFVWHHPWPWLFDWEGRLLVVVVGLVIIGWSLHLKRNPAIAEFEAKPSEITPTKPDNDPFPSEELWTWPPLSPNEIKKSGECLKAFAPQYVQISATDAHSKRLIASFQEMMRQAGWGFTTRDRYKATGYEGITVEPLEQNSRQFVEIVEANTSLRLTLTPRPAQGPPLAKGAIALVIDSRPPPQVTAQMQREMTAFGNRLVKLSAELADFFEGRSRIVARLRSSAGLAGGDLYERRREFDTETNAACERQYGDRMRHYRADLEMMGFVVPYHLDSNPQLCQRWFSEIGALLLEGRLSRARSLSANQQYWFTIGTSYHL